MERPSIVEINALIAVIELRSFANAARKLRLSPPRVSEIVRSLEERLGVRLVERTTRSVAPTAAGERLAQRLRPVLEDFDAALESVNDFRSRPAGMLRLTVVPPAANFILAPTIPQFLARYPDIDLEINIDSASKDIIAERYDAGIRTYQELDKDMIALRLSDDISMVVVAAPTYLERRGVPSAPLELMEHDCIRFSLPRSVLYPWRLKIDGKVGEVRVSGRYTINDYLLATRAAVDGVGLLQAPLPYVARDISEGRLVRVLDEWAPPQLEGLFLYYPSRRQNSAAFQALLEFLRSEGASHDKGF